jgi:hypothetical protein
MKNNVANRFIMQLIKSSKIFVLRAFDCFAFDGVKRGRSVQQIGFQ